MSEGLIEAVRAIVKRAGNRGTLTLSTVDVAELRELLAAAPVPCAASPADRHPEFPQFAACVHCHWISAKEICPNCDRERDSGIKPLRATGEGARDEPVNPASLEDQPR